MAIRQDSFRVEKGQDYLAYVRDYYGDEAEIVAVTQVEGRTPTSPAMVEVVVAINDTKEKKQPIINKRAALHYENSLKEFKSDNFDRKIAIENKQNQNENKSLNQDLNSKKELSRLKFNPNSSNKSKDDKQLLNELNSKVDYLMSMRWGELAPARNNLEIPPEFALIYDKAKKSDMLQTHLDEIMRATLKNMPKALLSNKEAITRYFTTLLKSMIPCRVDAPIRKQKIIMLVGPTGVGKTTTLAKLAYRYAYGSKRYKTAIVSLDNFRLGAKEQLAEYARTMRLPIAFVSTEEDLHKNLETLSGYDVVLIDSTGNSQYDKTKIEKLESYLKASESEIEVALVLNAGMKYDDMEETFNAFNALNIDTLILTKFDETRAFGNIFSLIFNIKKPVSFFSIGQNVPDDILVANSEYLIKCVLDGFKG